jgi:hypothetical protein
MILEECGESRASLLQSGEFKDVQLGLPNEHLDRKSLITLKLFHPIG